MLILVSQETLTRIAIGKNFDSILEFYSTDKIKSVGSTYMCVTNLFENCVDHQKQAAMLAIEMKSFILENYPELTCTVGLHCGPLIAAILGKKKYRYDVVSDTVNTASRLCTTAEPNTIQWYVLYCHIISRYKVG